MSAKCTICEIRNIGSYASYGDGDKDYAKAVQMCVPCATEAGWENTHSDNGHDAEDLDNDEREYAKICWVCHPELNNAQNLKARQHTGTSRAGIVLHVTPKADGFTKATEAAAQFGEQFATAITKPSKRNAYVTTLKAASSVGNGYKLRWDAQGRFVGGERIEDGKARKVRNVAEALRLAK